MKNNVGSNEPNAFDILMKRKKKSQEKNLNEVNQCMNMIEVKRRKASNNLTSKENAFQLLMRNSRTYTSVPNKRFHLNKNGNLSWFESSNIELLNSSVEWSSTISLNKNPREKGRDKEIFELVISSSVPCAENSPFINIVKRPSRLSVSVLKSILQKSIRRRLSLSATKVAMELASKSLSELLRRLPIICIEDSLLHPDFSYLVWLMVAHSKNFIPDKILAVRLMQIVYQIASCPFHDSLCGLYQGENNYYNLTENFDGLPTNCALTLRCMLIRIHYGGMECDISMLAKYMILWKKRYEIKYLTLDMNEKVSLVLSQKCPKHDINDVSWHNFSSILHKSAVKESKDHVGCYMYTGVKSLSMKDICFAGIDFHCSSIIDDILNDELLENIQNNLNSGSKSDISSVFTLVKLAMWHLSAGVNLKDNILKNTPATKHSEDEEKVWDIIFPSIQVYTLNFLKARLAK